ncbi:leucine-rich repeat domain-containing protein [Gammaproteobacteria bacterium]|nr:leucine-rich repeat domain-containing protein [Gammaproteobacteria bacterium]
MKVTIKPLIHTALSLLLFSLAGPSYAQVPQIERDALVTLYNSTDGANWTDNTGWMGAVGTECSWSGVTCTNGSVSRLWFWTNGLNGTIPSELGNLSNLTSLNLGNNSLTGTIPSELGNLTKLTQILLFSNSLTGSIPSELGNLANLTYLQLSNNTLSGSIPSELGNLTNLTYLNLSNNSLSGSIPSELGNLTKLAAFSYTGNLITGSIPNGLGSEGPKISSIERNALVALYNSTDGVNWTDNTGWLGEVGTECSWFGVTCSSGSVTQINLYDNSLSGSIPAELGNLVDLTTLNLSNPFLHDGNSLSGSIPSELGNLANLTYLQLSNNSLSGVISSELGSLTNLVTFRIRGNSLTGNISELFKKMTKLSDIALWDGNVMTGTIPKKIYEKKHPSSWVEISHSNHYAEDGDRDGIKDEIDTDLTTASQIKTVTTPDYSISILGSGRVVNLVSSNGEFEEFIAGIKKAPDESMVKKITNILYQHFGDEFDFIQIVPACFDALRCVEDIYGSAYVAKHDVKGIGGEIIDKTAEYGSAGKLKTVNWYPHLNGITRGPSLHELMHTWGNKLGFLDEYRGVPEIVCPGHWGWSNIGGQLGGWKPHSLEKLSDGSYQAKGTNTRTSNEYHFGGLAQGDNQAPYGDFELYMMGLIGPDEVKHDIKIAQDFTWKDKDKGIFEASTINVITMNELINNTGMRASSHLESQKNFRAMYVVISEVPLKLNEWAYIDKEIYDFQLQGDDGNKNYNFWEATQGKGTITFDQVDTFLTSPATLSALVSSPAVSIIGGDKAVSDTDSAAGESVSFTATATDSDGTIATTQWLIDGVEVATGLSATLSLPDGLTVVTFKATDDDGTSSTTTATITITAPAYEPTEEWPSPYNGVTPDSSFGLAFNNIGVFSASDSIIYTCLRVFTDGLSGSVGGISEFDIGLKVVSLSEATVQITKFREFNAIGALNENAQIPDCSGIFETTTGIYTDIIVAGDSVLDTTWSLIDPTNLILRLSSYQELTAN